MFNNSTGFTMPVVPANYGYGGGGYGMGGFGGDWWGIIVLLLLFGAFNGNGFGGFGGFGAREGCATQADVRNAVDQQTLISKLDQQTYGLADSTYAINNSISGGFAGVQQTLCQGFNGVNTAMLQGFNGVQSQLASCCCDIERGIEGVNYNLATTACDIKHTLSDNTRDIIENQNCNTRSILDFLVNDKIATLQAENQNLKLKASQAEQNAFISANQQAQTAELIRRLGADCPVPAYVVPNPNCCYNPFGFGYNYNGYGNSGCGCGCGC